MNVTGIILAGGMGQRMGGVDKGLLALHGKPLITHVLNRLEPQVDEVLINANREIEAYVALGKPVISDIVTGFAGPLAGLHCGMTHATHPLVATVPCDSPFFPTDLVSRLFKALEARHADLAVARIGPNPQPVFCLCYTSLLPNLARFLQDGGRKIGAWQASLNTVEVAFDDNAEAFANINTPEELGAYSEQDA
jgi:molybdopterin-guanine dinucleotide biosynthesis protein A